MVDRFSKIILSLSLCSGTIFASEFAPECASELMPEMKNTMVIGDCAEQVLPEKGVLAEISAFEEKTNPGLKKEEKTVEKIVEKIAVLKKDLLAEQEDSGLKSGDIVESLVEPGLVTEIEAIAEPEDESITEPMSDLLFENDHPAALTDCLRRIAQHNLYQSESPIVGKRSDIPTNPLAEQNLQSENQPAEQVSLEEDEWGETPSQELEDDEVFFESVTTPGIPTLSFNEFDDIYPVDEDESFLWDEDYWKNGARFFIDDDECDDDEFIVDEDCESPVIEEDSALSDEFDSNQDDEIWEEDFIEDPDQEYFKITIEGKNPQAVLQHLFKFYGDTQALDEMKSDLTNRTYYGRPQRVFANWNPFQNYWGQRFGYPRVIYPRSLSLARNLPLSMMNFF